MQTVKEFLVANFGNSALQIEGLDLWGNDTFERASFPIDNSRIFVSCGMGECIMAFDTKDQRPKYLVIDGSEGIAWVAMKRRLKEKHEAGGCTNDALSKEEWEQWHSSKPHNKMKLCQSA